MWHQPFVSNWRPTSSNPILTQRTPWETGTRPLLVKIAAKNKQIAQVRFHFWARILVPILGTKCFLFYSNAPKNRSPKQNPKKRKKAPTRATNFRAVYSGLFLTAPGIQHALDVASSMSILDILRNNLPLAFSTPGLRRFVCMKSLTFRFQKWGAKLKTWSLFQLLPFMLFLPSWITPCWIQTHICNNKRWPLLLSSDTVEASKPDWPKLCKYGPQNKHHGTLANCSSCNHKLQNLSSRTYPGSNTEPAENPFKTTCHIFRCVNSWLASGAREPKAEPFQNTWTGELQQRPHTQWLPRTHKQEPSKSAFRQSRIKTRLGLRIDCQNLCKPGL